MRNPFKRQSVDTPAPELDLLSRVFTWEVRSNANPKFVVRLADCDAVHANSVLVQLQEDDSAPNDLELHPVTEGR